MLDRIANIAAAIVSVALAAVIVGSPNTAKIVTATGKAFGGALKSAKH